MTMAFKRARKIKVRGRRAEASDLYERVPLTARINIFVFSFLLPLKDPHSASKLLSPAFMVSARPAALAVLAFAASGLLVHGEAVDGASVGADPTTNITTTTITTVTATTKQPVTPTSTSSASSSPTTTSSTPYEVPLRTGVLAGALSGSLIVVFGIVIVSLRSPSRARTATNHASDTNARTCPFTSLSRKPFVVLFYTNARVYAREKRSVA